MIEFRGLLVDVDAGLVYGKRGHPIGSPDRKGYLRLSPRCMPDGKSLFAHRVVWMAANGPIPDGLEINHRNGIKTDNRLANLELVTRSENMRHACALGLKSNAGERHPTAKLTWAAVREIRSRHASGVAKADLARRFGVHRRTINDIVLGNNWKEAAA